jgi:AMMECR1 domain-containing protein
VAFNFLYYIKSGRISRIIHLKTVQIALLLAILSVTLSFMHFWFLLWFLMLSLAPLRADDFAAQLQTPKVQNAALQLSRRAMQTFLQSGKTIAAPADLPPALKRRAGVFVTVEKRGQITPRGCRGTLQPISGTLGEEIIRNSIAACSRDSRVAPLKLGELPRCLISLSVVLRVTPIASIAAHDVENNGLIARSGSKIGIVLPYEGRDSQTQEKWAKRKAGLAENASAQLLELVAVRFRESAASLASTSPSR